jgi:hypothetical protein
MARAGDVSRAGACSIHSDWTLKAGHRDGRIEVEFEVDQNRVGQKWRVRLTDNGTPFYIAYRMTKAPSGSFTVQTTTANRIGTDLIVGRAVNVTTGQVCRGFVSL